MESKDIMTDKEAEYWDDYYTKNTIMPDPSKNRLLTGEGPVAHIALSLRDLDNDVAEYVRAQALTTRQTNAQVVNAIIRKELAV
jgi:hypothetical protein